MSQRKSTFSSLFETLNTIISGENQELIGEQKSSAQKQHVSEIETAVLVLTAEVIKANRNFDNATEKAVREYLTKQFGSADATKIKQVANYIETGTEPFVKISCTVLNKLTTDESRLLIIKYLFEVAAADDFVNAKEKRTIHRISKYLKLNELEFNNIKDSFIELNNPYAVFGLDENAPFELVKSTYRKMVLKFHPDKRGNEISEAEATAKFRAIQRAFEIIKG
jgi:DnaJ like chaperone protein